MLDSYFDVVTVKYPTPHFVAPHVIDTYGEIIPLNITIVSYRVCKALIKGDFSVDSVIVLCTSGVHKATVFPPLILSTHTDMYIMFFFALFFF